MEVGQGPNLGCSAKGKKNSVYIGLFETAVVLKAPEILTSLQTRILRENSLNKIH
jgi:hypothetical protein